MAVSRKEAWPVSRGVLLLLLATGKFTVLASQANDDWTNRYSGQQEDAGFTRQCNAKQRAAKGW